MKRWFFGQRKHIDEEKKAQEAADLSNLRWLMDNGTQEEYEAYVRGVRPDATDEEFKAMLDAFYAQRSARRQLREV